MGKKHTKCTSQRLVGVTLPPFAVGAEVAGGLGGLGPTTGFCVGTLGGTVVGHLSSLQYSQRWPGSVV